MIISVRNFKAYNEWEEVVATNTAIKIKTETKEYEITEMEDGSLSIIVDSGKGIVLLTEYEITEIEKEDGSLRFTPMRKGRGK